MWGACGDTARVSGTDTASDTDTALAPDTAFATDPATDTTFATDTAADTAAITDTATVVITPSVGDHVRATLTDGRVGAGELVAIYDHRPFWWTPEDRETWALFDPGGLAPAYEDDHSFTFVAKRDVADLVVSSLPAAVEPYRDALRSRGVVLDRLPLDGVAYVVMAGAEWHLAEDGYGHFAWDLSRTGASGFVFAPPGTANADYYVWGAPISLPVGGTIVAVTRDAPDGAPNAGTIPLDAVNNGLLVHVYGHFYLQLLHQQQDSIPADLAVGTWHAPGTFAGLVGNSGVSQAPHLHVALLWFDATSDRSWSVPVEFGGLYVSSSPGAATLHRWASPLTGEWVSSAKF